jgi:hypothetical protein
MGIWPELRSAYNVQTGKELAKSSLDDFLGFVLYYNVNGSDQAHAKREAVYKVLYDEPVDTGEFNLGTVSSMEDELLALEKRLREGVE